MTNTNIPYNTPLTAAIIVTGVGQAIVDQLLITPESGGVPDKMRLCLLVPGAIAADACACGQLALSILSWEPMDVFPVSAAETATRAPCGERSRGVRAIATIFRCVPTMDSQGRPPTCDALFAAALVQNGDEYAMRKGITCYLAELKRLYKIADYRVGNAVPLGPEGACGGVEITFAFQTV